MDIILPQKDKIIFKPFPVWIKDLKHLVYVIKNNIEKKDGWLESFNLLCNQLSLLMFILKLPDQSKKICDLSIHLMYKEYKRKNDNYFLNYIIQPKINMTRLCRLVGDDFGHLKMIEGLHPKKLKILDMDNLFNNIDKENKFLLINNLILEKFKYHYKLCEYKKILRIVEKYFYLCPSFNDLLNEVKFIALFNVDYELAFKFCCEHINNNCKNYLKNYWTLRICQCLKKMGSNDFLYNILDKMCTDFLDQIKIDVAIFRINLGFFVELAKLCHNCGRNLYLLDYFCFASKKIGDEKSELFFLQLIGDKNNLNKIEDKSIYSHKYDHKQCLNSVNGIHVELLNFIEKKNAI